MKKPNRKIASILLILGICFSDCREVSKGKGDLAFLSFLSRLSFKYPSIQPGREVAAFSLAGKITGLTVAGLVLASGTSPNQTLSIDSDATSFQFPNLVLANATYAVSITTLPIGLNCIISNASGTISDSVNSVTIDCSTLPANSFVLGGSIVGLSSAGLVLSSGTLPNQTLNIASGTTSFQFPVPVPTNASFAVTIRTLPVGLFCTLSNENGTISENVTTINVLCSANPIVATPIFSPTPGNYGTPQPNITITTATSGATIYFTKDGTTPTTSSTVYTTGLGHIWFLAGRTLKAIAVKSGSTDSAVATAEYSYLPLKSGQTSSQATGDDGWTQLGIARSYTDNGNSTVTDNATGLLWQKCSIGQTPGTCGLPAATSHTGLAAPAQCTLLGSNWRLPSRYELETLPDYSSSNPSINNAFSNTVFNYYWTSTLDAQDPVNKAWLLTFGDASNLKDSKGLSHKVRCVSGENQISLPKYADNGNGTIFDKQTGLTWQKCSIGQTGATCTGGSATPLQWGAALTACNGSLLANRSWRLANINELKTLVEVGKVATPMLDTVFFPTSFVGNYWSSTTYAPNSLIAWVIDFTDSANFDSNKNVNNRVRCVSGP